MMPLIFAGVGEPLVIIAVKGPEEVRRHLGDLGFLAGAQVIVIARNAGNVILQVKDTRIAIDQRMANKILVEGGLMDADFAGNKAGRRGHCCENSRGRWSKAAVYGHGNHKGNCGAGQKGCSSGGSHGNHGKGI
jgi:ferrous iron transport protein A